MVNAGLRTRFDARNCTRIIRVWGLEVQLIEKVRSVASQALGRLNGAAQIAVIVLACILFGGLIFWLCNELVYYFIARSYAEELADAYDLNTGITRAILWASFAAIVVL